MYNSTAMNEKPTLGRLRHDLLDVLKKRQAIVEGKMAPRKKEEEDMADMEDIRSNNRQRDMILAPNEYAFISDETKGDISVFVGPNKTSLAGTDRPVVFDSKTKKFVPCDLSRSLQTFQTAPEGWYVVLKNPAENDKTPSGSGKLTTPSLRVGKKVNIPGPVSFPLWPGQMAKVVKGHNLKSNEYLLVRVYDEEAAKANWGRAVIKTQSEGSDGNFDIPSERDLTMGKLFVIRGTDVSFYIPPTGIEVVTEQTSAGERYVREAVSLERLEYCLLLDQDGNKRYVRGPAVVFPKPTERFVEAPIKSNPEKASAKKFRAQELTATSGIHIRVIADYTNEQGKQFKAGDELFITGAEQPVYFPREEHAIIKYGEQDVHYGIAIPAGEARYVLNRLTGEASLVQGPRVFLPDPRSQVILQRALDPKVCSMLYPGNDEALAINASRLGYEEGGNGAAAAAASYTESTTLNDGASALVAADSSRKVLIRAASKALPGDAFDRKNKFTAPRSVILNTKYDGAVTVKLWTNFAMLLVRNNERRVIQGPGTFMLEYDENPQVMSLSTGKPKTTDKLYQTVYLQTTANMVSDIVSVETRDFCKLDVKVSYRVNFEGDPNTWFNVDNYVKFLCDHMRSKLRNAVQKLSIEEFYGAHVDVVRDVVLGKGTNGSSRPGTTFSENGMRVYDVEVLAVKMQNSDVENMLINAQREVIQNALTLATQRRQLDYVKETEQLKREQAIAHAETVKLEHDQATELERLRNELEIVKINGQDAVASMQALLKQKATEATLQIERTTQETAKELEELRLVSQKQRDEHTLAQLRAKNELEIARLVAEADAFVRKGEAISPDLIAALQAFGDKEMIAKVASSMAPLSILGGSSVVEVLKNLLAGSPLAKQLEAGPTVSNGTGRSRSADKASA